MTVLSIANYRKLLRRRAKRGKPTDFYLQNSECIVSVSPGDSYPESVHIEFHGELARLPSLKNSKIPGKNFTAPDTLARLKAMTRLFQNEVQEMGLTEFFKLNFGEIELHVLVICGERVRSFDTDNCLAAVKDWLEPWDKAVGGRGKKRPRGWGVGLTPNDKFVTGYAVHSHQTGMTTQHSTIVVRPWESIRPAAVEFIAQNFLTKSRSKQ